MSRYDFSDGDQVMFVDRRGRRYLVKLETDGRFDTHIGAVLHNDVIGQPDGARITTTRNHRVIAVKPSLADFVREMPRIATVIYPKDLGPILIYGDIFPGAKVLEAGAGSGSLTITLLRAVGPDGHVSSYDLREDMLERTRQNVDVMVPNHDNLTLAIGDVYEEIQERDLDRIILDLPEPWQVVPHASESLVPGGVFLSFLPTILQVHELVGALRAQRTFDLIETFEILMRPWTVGGRSVRPDHRMVAHTGFITTAKKCQPRPVSSDDEDSKVSG